MQQQSVNIVEPFTVAMPAPSLPKKNVVAYMAGYLLNRYPVDSCETCTKLYKLHSLPESSSTSVYELLRCNMYKDSSNLKFASVIFTEFVQTLETVFCFLFGGAMHMSNVLQTLCKSTEKEVQNLDKCGQKECLQRLHNCVKLYMTVRIHHAIKVSNISAAHGHKRNRKMLKLCHE